MTTTTTEEPGNEQRAQWARAALEAFSKAHGAADTFESEVRDLIVDLLHLVSREDDCEVDWILETARRHFEEEHTS